MLILGASLVILVAGFIFFFHVRRRRRSKLRGLGRGVELITPSQADETISTSTPVPTPSPFRLEFLHSSKTSKSASDQKKAPPTNSFETPLKSLKSYHKLRDRLTILDISLANQSVFPSRQVPPAPTPRSPSMPSSIEAQHLSSRTSAHQDERNITQGRFSSRSVETRPPSYHSRISRQGWGLEEIEREIDRMIRWVERDREITGEENDDPPNERYE